MALKMKIDNCIFNHFDLHCKFLQGTVGSLQGIQATGISYLQGFSMHVITCKEFIGIATNNYRDFYCFFINQGYDVRFNGKSL